MKSNHLLLITLLSTVYSQNATFYKTQVERSQETSKEQARDNLIVEQCLHKNCTRICNKRCDDRQTAWFNPSNSSFECIDDKHVMYKHESKFLDYY